MPKVFVSVGSSLHRYDSVAAGLSKLVERFSALQVSPVFESEAVGFAGPAFLNLAVSFSTELAVNDLIRCLKDIEDSCGRNRSLPKNSPQTLDLDLLTYGDASGELEGIVLPRPGLLDHAFVLWPLAELAPNEVCPGVNKTFAELWLGWQGDQALHPVDFIWQGNTISADQIRFGCSESAIGRE
ncbi:2-amino-4-hydroxy-6-hydroxymethyldihydropteridine diphosphokinase [Salinibius halmophilus]|uniref:2-amino-4-hydroxy-6- hydroxymethyldihydropteridine diphosphokinase n=1 Tax=Salinibius halmophilus TaxID=1853216 RepID=UPI000E664515|nr:2-amino-4-hydroxy-6-hydroxymethyldihydropteridine diphosphokinase [Salinibius halmophilus]